MAFGAPGAEGCVDEEGAEGGDGDGEEAAAFTAAALRSWTQKSPVVRTFIRPGAARKLHPPPDRGAGGEGEDREGAGAAEEE